MSTPPADPLGELAAAYGVATWYDDQRHRRVSIPTATVRRLLTILGVDPERPPSPAPTPTPTPTPRAMPVPDPAWGWLVQLYAVRSADSWGIGDLADLAELARWSGAELGAGFIVVNPLHAPSPVLPLENSPYFPTSRRFTNPLYLRVEDCPEYLTAPAEVRAAVDRIGATLRAGNRSDRIDRDTVWRGKLAALELLWPYVRRDALDAFLSAEGTPLRDFAVFCALAERYGVPWQSWPAALHDPHGAAVARAADELADRVGFHSWLQLLAVEQLAGAQSAARAAGLSIGIVHDLAVGVDPGGADAWALHDVLAAGVSVGAPPDPFNQKGQNWRLPPWHPTRLAAAGYAPYRELIRAALRHGGGIRIDHILGLFRLWWIPEGLSADLGGYVRYDAAALLDILVEEAQRTGAVLVGEDLGTVEPRVRAELAGRGILGCVVAWFARDEDPDTGADRGFLRPREWREPVLASVSTHDLPTAVGFLTTDHVRVRAELGQLTRPVEEEQRAAELARDELLALLRAEGLIGADPTLTDCVVAVHALLARSPCRLRAGQLADAVGDRRAPNLPGTTDEYPNWRLPLADDTGRPVLLDDLYADPRVRRTADALAGRCPPTTLRDAAAGSLPSRRGGPAGRTP